MTLCSHETSAMHTNSLQYQQTDHDIYQTRTTAIALNQKATTVLNT